MKKYTLLFLLCLGSLETYSQTFVSTTGVIPDNSCTSSHEFPFVVSGVGILGTTNIFDQIVVDITMSYDGDLDITLVAPNGTSVSLSIGNGGAGANYTNTIFRPDAAVSIVLGTAPFTGIFLPEGDLSALNGLDADGTWLLRICDTGIADVGTLNSSSLTFVTAPTCFAPTNVFANIITSTTSNFIWDAVAGSVNYEYVLDNTAVIPLGSGTFTTATDYFASSLSPETEYYFHVRNNCGAEFSSWATTSFVTPPLNDACADAIGIVSLPYNFTQNAFGATNNAGFISSCGAGMNDGVWYTFTVDSSGDVSIAITGLSSWDPEIAVYSGSCGAFTCVGSVDAGALGDPETLNLTALASGQYRINIGDYSGTTDNLEGMLTIDVTGTAVLLGRGSFENAGFLYYPNSVKDVLNLSYTQNIANVTVYNLLGQQALTKGVNANQSQVDMSDLSKGIYIVKVTADNQIKTIKVIKE